MKKYLWAICYGLALTAFTTYISLDTFVLSSTYQTDTTQMNTSMFAQTEENASVIQDETAQSQTDSSNSDEEIQTEQQDFSFGNHSDNTSNNTSSKSSTAVSDTTYEDANINITLTEYYQNNTKIYVADVQLSTAEYLKTAFADNTYGKTVTAKTSDIAASNNAILAINGDYYGAKEKGYVIRNGVVYRSTASSDDLLCIYANGTMKVMSQSDYTADELVEQNVWQAFTFGPGLIENGSITVSQNDEVGKAMASNPRTAIGIISENHYLFVVSDGRTSESAGLSLYQLAQFMQSLGATTAYNLDGGGSSTMYFKGQVINNPTTNGNIIKERRVSDIVYIG